MLKQLFNKKYKLFAKKIRDVQNSMWELEFKIHKARQMREDARLRRDRAVEAIHQINKQLETEKDKDKIQQLNTDKQQNEAFQKSYESQMRMIDEQIQGVEETPDSPSQVGLNETLKGLAELRQMYKDYIKTI